MAAVSVASICSACDVLMLESVLACSRKAEGLPVPTKVSSLPMPPSRYSAAGQLAGPRRLAGERSSFAGHRGVGGSGGALVVGEGDATGVVGLGRGIGLGLQSGDLSLHLVDGVGRRGGGWHR